MFHSDMNYIGQQFLKSKYYELNNSNLNKPDVT